MKCKNCKRVYCSHRRPAKEECFYTSHPDNPLPIDKFDEMDLDGDSFRKQAAIAAMQGLMSCGRYEKIYTPRSDYAIGEEWRPAYSETEAAILAVKYADALIDELRKEKSK